MCSTLFCNDEAVEDEGYIDAFPMKMPYWIVDDIMPLLTPSEFVVLMAVVRHSYSTGVLEKDISHDEFMYGVGREDGSLRSGTRLGRSAIRRCLKTLVDKRIISHKKAPVLGRGRGVYPKYGLLDKSGIDFNGLEVRMKEIESKMLKKGRSLTEIRVSSARDDEDVD